MSWDKKMICNMPSTPCTICRVPWFSEWKPQDNNTPYVQMEPNKCGRCGHKQTAQELAHDLHKHGVLEYGLATFTRCSRCQACGRCGQRIN